MCVVDTHLVDSVQGGACFQQHLCSLCVLCVVQRGGSVLVGESTVSQTVREREGCNHPPRRER